MISLEQCRKIDPSLKDLPDEELKKVRDTLYGLGKLAFSTWVKKKSGSNFPLGLLPKNQSTNKM